MMDDCMDEELLEDRLVRLGDMMGDGLHLEPSGKWIEREYDDRKDKGYINHVKAFSKVEPEDYYGLLGKYLTKETHKYIESRCVFGYLGHEDRTKETDKVICEFLDENPDMKERVNRDFLCSGIGRHYMDNYSGPEDLRKFLGEL